MSTENMVQAITLPAAADFSSSQYLIVDVNSSGQAALVTTQGANAVGVLQDNPGAAGRAARIAIGGVLKVMAGATIAAGNRITSGADSRAEVAATGDFVLGTAISGGADGEIISVLWQPQDISA